MRPELVKNMVQLRPYEDSLLSLLIELKINIHNVSFEEFSRPLHDSGIATALLDTKALT